MLVVFDLDGTLVDSRRDLADASNELLASYGAPPLGEVEVGRMVGEGAAVLVSRLLEARGLAVRLPEALDRFLDYYNGRLTAHTRPYDGIPEAVDAIGAFADLAVLTNKPTDATERILAALELRRPFRWVIGGSSGYPRKPDPAGLLFLAGEAGVAPGEAVLIGDSIVDLRTARSAGTRLCLARYGFGYLSVPEDEVLGDAIVDHPSELPGLLRPADPAATSPRG